MTDYRAQVILKTVDAIPANYVTNSLAFKTSPDGPLNTGAVTTAIKDFYDDLLSYLSINIAQNGHEIKYSALPGTPPNYPFEEDTFNLASSISNVTLPTEVSMVLSFQGPRTAGFPQARRRGRIYIGPLGTVTNSLGRPAAAAITALANAAATFKSNIETIGAGDHLWSVWSHADQQGVAITNGWVDNAFDTQRRRGVSATSRTTWI